VPSDASSAGKSKGGYETPVIRNTNFPIPSGAVFVSPNGKGGGAGTANAPYNTLERALAAAPAGGTIVLRGGTYGQSLGSLRRRVIIQAYPHEQPWIRGGGKAGSTALTIGSGGAGSYIRGIGFEYWGSKSANSEAVRVSGSNVTFDSDTFAFSAQRALGIYGTNTVVINSMIVDSGASNVNAHNADGLDFEHNEVAYSNMKHASIAPTKSAQIGGVKVTNTTNTVFRGNDFHNNDSNGLWFDQQSAEQVIVSNRIIENAGHGMAIEVSGHSIVAENVIVDNGRDGLKLSGANDAAVYNNTVAGNGWAQIGVYEDPRHTKGLATSDSTNISIANNVFMAGTNAQKYVFYSFDLDHPAHLTTLHMVSYDDHNVYGRSNAGRPKDLAYTQASATKHAVYANLAAFQKAMHRELSSKSADGWSFNNMFAGPSTFNFTLTKSAPKAAPTALPRAIADALNTSPNVSHVGA
jgi:parallel beta-helix repeat protein